MWLRVDTMREQQTPKQAAPTDNDTDRRTFFYRAAISIGALFAVRHASDLNNAKLPPRPQDDDRDCNAFRFGPEQTNEQRPSAPQEVVEKPLVDNIHGCHLLLPGEVSDIAPPRENPARRQTDPPIQTLLRQAVNRIIIRL